MPARTDLARLFKVTGIIWVFTSAIAWVVLNSVHTGGAMILMLLVFAWPFLLYAEHGSALTLIASLAGQFVYSAGLYLAARPFLDRRIRAQAQGQRDEPEKLKTE